MRRLGRFILMVACMSILLSTTLSSSLSVNNNPERSDTATRSDITEDFVVSNTTVVDGENWTVTASIIVKSGGKLVISNTDLTFSSHERNVYLTVEPGGLLCVYNSTITAASIVSFNTYVLDIEGEITVVNSSILFAGLSLAGAYVNLESGGVDLEGATGHFYNTTFEFVGNIVAGNSTLTVQNSTFIENLNGLKAVNTKLTLDNCDFINGYNKDLLGDIYIKRSDGFKISNSTFSTPNFLDGEITTDTLGIGLFNSTGELNYCNFLGKERGIDIKGDTSLTDRWGSYRIDGCIFALVKEGIDAMFTSLNVTNSIFDYPVGPDSEAMLEESRHSYGIEVMLSDLDIFDSEFNNCSIGVVATGGVTRVFNTFFTNSGSGVGTIGDSFRGDNLTVTDNIIGLSLSSAPLHLTNSLIERNDYGLTLQVFSESVILGSNRIFNNTKWGMIVEGVPDWIKFEGENFPAPAGRSANGIGNLVAIRPFGVEVIDGFNAPIYDVNVSIESECLQKYNLNNEISVPLQMDTVLSGKVTFSNLFTYVMIDGQNKIYCDDYILKAWIDLTKGISLEQSVAVDMQNDSNHTFIFILPNFYVSASDLKLSAKEVASGSNLIVDTVLRYTGPANVTMPAVNVSLVIDGVVIETQAVTGFTGTNDSKALSFSWKAETNVPLPNAIKERQVKIVVDVPNRLEYDAVNTAYTGDNTVSTYVGINPKEDEVGDWVFASGSPLAAMLFVCGIAVVILVVIIAVLYIMKKKKGAEARKAQETEESEQEKENEE